MPAMSANSGTPPYGEYRHATIHGRVHVWWTDPEGGQHHRKLGRRQSAEVIALLDEQALAVRSRIWAGVHTTEAAVDAKDSD